MLGLFLFSELDVIISSLFIIIIIIIYYYSVKYTSRGNPPGTSPHSEDGTQGKPDYSWLKADTTIYSLRGQHVTCGN
jgi:hypothetical protein